MVGTPHKSDAATDLAAVGAAIFVGGLIGTPFVVFHGFRLSLGTAVGALVVGIVLGWLYSVRPSFGRIPEAASSLMISLGLSACTGMHRMQAGSPLLTTINAKGDPLRRG